MRLFKRLTQPVMIATLAAALTACMLGPDFHAPKPPAAKRYNATPLPHKTVSTANAGKSGVSQYFVTAEDIPSEWWDLFHSAAINELVQHGIANNPNLAAAQATLRVAQETYNAQVGNLLFPAFDANVVGQRQRANGTSIGSNSSTSIFNSFGASVSASYLLDVFGASRRELEALQAQVDYQQFQLLGAYLTLTTNIVTTAIAIASFENQISATRDLIREQEYQLNILQKQFKLGGISSTEVLTQLTLVNQTRATLPPLEKNLMASKHALAVLIGETPDHPMPNIDLDKLTLPKHIPVSLPSDLVRQRPDIRASEALLHAASAQIGVATANLFPQFTLNGAFGWAANAPSSLFDPANKIWSYGAQIAQPIFHGGALLAQRRAAIASYDAAAAQYRQTLLQAFQNVADALRAIEIDARNLRVNKEAETAAKQSLFIITSQFRLGGVSYLALLTAQQLYQQTRIKRIQVQSLRYADTAVLFQALGGGWWNHTIQKCHDPINPTRASKSCPE